MKQLCVNADLRPMTAAISQHNARQQRLTAHRWVMNVAAAFCAERLGIYPGGQFRKFDGSNDAAITTPHLHTGQRVLAFIDLDHDEGSFRPTSQQPLWRAHRDRVQSVPVESRLVLL